MESKEKQAKQRRQEDEDELPVGWKQMQSAIWLVGLAILFWQGWFWPGILVVAAISGLFQGAVTLYLNRKEEQREQLQVSERLTQQREAWLPSTCPVCGAPISVSTVRWTGPNTADCPYCNANLRPTA